MQRLFNRALKPSASGIRPKTCVWTSPSGTPAVPRPFRSITETGTSPAARGRPPVEGKHPLILLSHDSAGSRFSLHELASELARNGFVVLAFTHPGDNVDDMGALFMPVQVTDRAKQLTQALDIALADPETAPLIDPDRIGVLGVGPGGTAAMLIAGARLDATRLAHLLRRKGRKRRSILHAVGTAAHGGFFHHSQPFRTLPRQACPRRSRRFPFLCHDVHSRQPVPHPDSPSAASCREDASLYPSARGTPPERHAPASAARRIARCGYSQPDVILAAAIWIRRFLKCALPSPLRAGRPYRQKWPPNPPPSSSNTSEPPTLHRFLLNPRTIPKSHHIPPRRKRTRPARRSGRDSEMDKKQVRRLPLKRERLPSEKRVLWKTNTPDGNRPGCLFSKTAPRGQRGHDAPLPPEAHLIVWFSSQPSC